MGFIGFVKITFQSDAVRGRRFMMIYGSILLILVTKPSIVKFYSVQNLTKR